MPKVHTKQPSRSTNIVHCLTSNGSSIHQPVSNSWKALHSIGWSLLWIPLCTTLEVSWYQYHDQDLQTMVHGLGNTCVDPFSRRPTIQGAIWTILQQYAHCTWIVISVQSQIKWTCWSCCQEHGISSWKMSRQLARISRSTPWMAECPKITRSSFTCTVDDRTPTTNNAARTPCCI